MKKEAKRSQEQKEKQACPSLGLREHLRQIPIKRIVMHLARIPWKKTAKLLGVFSRRVLLPLCSLLLCIALLVSGFAIVISSAVCHKTRDRIVTVEQLHKMDTTFDYILVLGCRVYEDGSLSHMLTDRVKTAVSLYEAGLCDTLIMSGDHQSDAYNEVDPMKAAAEAAGIPQEAILTDPLGLSTYDSIARLSALYEGKRVLIVTQSYHLYRALYVAEKLGLEAYGVSADLRSYVGQIKYDVREVAARCKDVFYAEARPLAVGLEE